MPTRKKHPKPITAALRKALADALASGESFIGLERTTGVLRQSLMKFHRGETSLRLPQADLLANYFRLEIRTPNRKGK
jgi:hypothetical protein